MPDLEVGQEVVIHDLNERRLGGPVRGTVVKIGRTLVTIKDRYGREVKYGIGDRRVRDNYGHSWFATLEQEAAACAPDRPTKTYTPSRNYLGRCLMPERCTNPTCLEHWLARGRIDIQPVRGKYPDERERWPETPQYWEDVERYRAALYDWAVDGRRLRVAPEGSTVPGEAIVSVRCDPPLVSRCLPLNHEGGPLLTSLMWPTDE